MNAQKENYICILFSRQNTRIGKLIRVFLPNSRYTHVAIAPGDMPKSFFSFSRFNYHSPFDSGLITEYPSHYLINGEDLTVKLCKVPLSNEEYANAIARLDNALTNKKELLYNLFDAMLLPLGLRARLNKTYTCVSFGAYVLGYDEIGDIGALEKKIERFTAYEGSYKSFVESYDLENPPQDHFMDPLPFFVPIKDFFALIGKLIKRKAAKTVSPL